MDKAEKESVIFGANLGLLPIANRNNLATAFSAGLKESVTACCAESDADMNEAVRDVDDALSCVSDMEFLGAKSKRFLKEGDPMSNKFCTMPVKLRFDDKNSRINFEKTLRLHSSLRASMSVPAPIRKEMKAFRGALMDRYRGEVVVVRLDTVSASLYAIRKVDKAEGWTQCQERFTLPYGILLPGYNAGAAGRLPPLVSEPIEGDGSGSDAAAMAIAY
jgi:hypothetical protein